MKQHKKANKSVHFFLLPLFLITCVVSAAILISVFFSYNGNNPDFFSEKVITLSHGWHIINSRGEEKPLTFPYVLDYGDDGDYILESTLPKDVGLISSPSFEFYSNYLDFSVYIDGKKIYEYPFTDSGFLKGTGNTWHYLRLNNYEGKTISIHMHGQLKDSITYYLTAPKLGAKSSMIANYTRQSLPAIILSSGLILLSILLLSLYFSLRRILGLNYLTFYISAFSLLFAFYLLLETSYAKIMFSNGYVIYVATFMLLSLLPIPLLCLFSDDLAPSLRRYSAAPIALCLLNFFIQSVLHFFNILNLRAMMPITHITIIISIISMMVLVLLSSRKGNKTSLFRLISALPMVLGGFIDIFLLWINKPSFNNILWFVLGVTAFIIIQFSEFITFYFTTYRRFVENDYLHKMAYSDALSGLGNRNAYENCLEALSNKASLDGLGCVVLDINRLKYINDVFGHRAGDTAIEETGRLIKSVFSKFCRCFRTGGDEFVLLFENCPDRERLRELCEQFSREIEQRGEALSIPLTVSAGFDTFGISDTGLTEFVSRVDTLMYKNKALFKSQSKQSANAGI